MTCVLAAALLIAQDQTWFQAGKLFKGAKCGLCQDPMWRASKKMMECVQPADREPNAA